MATILGTNAAETLGITGMSSSADRISASGGNDTLVYELSTAGGADAYYGGTGVDVLELRFTAAEWATHSAQVLAMQKLVADKPKSVAGSVSAGTNFGKLDFGSGKSVQVVEVESVSIFVDGVEYTGETPAPVNKEVVITSAAQAGNVTEDGTLGAMGTVTFTDADLADAHMVAFTPAAGQTSLGVFALGSVSESASTAAGSVGWTYTLNNASAAVQALAAGEVVTEQYTVMVADDSGSTKSQVVTITITGAADAPPLVTTDEGAVVEAGTGVAGTPEATGKMPLEGVATSAVWETYVSDEIVADGYSNGYEFGDFTISADGVWHFTLNQAHADYLAQDEQVALVFAVTATEAGQTSVRREVVITLTGTDDATVITPVAGADVTVVEAGGIDNAINDDAGASGKLNIADADDASVTFVAGLVQGTYGDLTIDADGNWGYSLRNDDTNVQALKAGQAVQDTIIVHGTDGSSASVTLKITGADDAATMTIVDTYDETAVGAAPTVDDALTPEIEGLLYDNLVVEASGRAQSINPDPKTSGQLSLADPDGGSLLFHALDGAAREDGNFAGSLSAGTYGNFALDTATGKWTYTVDNTLAATQALNDDPAEGREFGMDTLVVYSADGQSSQAITVYIKGMNDGVTQVRPDALVPMDTTVEQDHLLADGTMAPSDLTAGGTLETIDPDTLIDPTTLEPVAGKDFLDGSVDLVAGGWAGAEYMLKGTYGIFTMNAGDVLGDWSYTADPLMRDANPNIDSDGDLDPSNDIDVLKNINSLGAGQSVTDTAIIKSKDGFASYAINVRLTGYNDAATLDAVVIDASGNVIADDREVTEAGGVNNGIAGDKLAGGVVKFNDIDAGETGFAAGTATMKVGTYGNFTLNTTTGAWTYTLDNSKTIVQQLKANEAVTDTWQLTSKDGTKANLTVDVIGADDATSIAEVGTSDKIVKESGGVNNAVKDTVAGTTAGGTLSIADPDGLLEDNEAAFADVFSTAGDEGNFTIAGVAQSVDEAALVYSDAAAPVDGKIWSKYGYFTFNDATNKWGYTLVEKGDGLGGAMDGAAAATNALSAGEKAMDVLRVYAANMSSSLDLKVNITGANDAAVITNTVDGGFDLSLQTVGFEKAVNTGTAAAPVWVANPVTADLSTSGVLAVVDPDGGPAGAVPTFKTIAASSLKGIYGDFTFDAPSGAWTYAINTNDADTRKLLIGQSAIDKLNVTATDGSVYTVNVTVNGANNAAELLVDSSGVNQVFVNGVGATAGSITYKVADGDAGAKLTMQVVDAAGIVRDVTALTVVDGGISTVKAPTANSTVLYEGMMQVTDKTAGHAAALLDTYLGLGTKNGDTITAATSSGSLIAGVDGNDTLTGNTGTDYLSGGAGMDLLVGSTGKDTLSGGAGVDNLTGGDAGSPDGEADTFVFMTAATDFAGARLVADTITDFETGIDKILVNKALLQATYYKLTDVQKDDGTGTMVAGTDGIFETIKMAKAAGGKALNAIADDVWFRSDVDMIDTGINAGKVNAGSPTLTAEDRFIYESATGTLWYDADGNGTGLAQRVAELGAGTGFAHTDIQFG